MACVAVSEVKDVRSFSTVPHFMFPSQASNAAAPKSVFFVSNTGRNRHFSSASLVLILWGTGQQRDRTGPDAEWGLPDSVWASRSR